MSKEILTTILIVLVSVNFVLWIALGILIIIQIRKLFKKVHSIVDQVDNFSSSMMGYAVKIIPVILGLVKGVQTVKSITTLNDIWDPDDQKEEKNGKKKK